ncbi:RNA-binding protein Cwf29 [Emydomyces testavorans]|uniref:RNA-binding protein Cwf29 n=1 Tax=Emydomyces testavorans TaxID=2070801 RepID=A0AAF0DCT3_9EURO|nr:RNA-binding protein Cwf29 [Emydomyces testavorans]
MNSIRQIQALNKRELENAVSPEASWHADYRDTAYIYIGGLPYDLSEGDILTIFSQFGEPVHLNLVRDKETGKSKGFAFLKYEDQRSTDLAVDNLCGASVMGRLLRVDHMRYKRKEEECLEDNIAELDREEQEKEQGVRDRGRDRNKLKKRRSGSESDDEKRRRRPLLKEEQELARLIEEHDDEDPMKGFLIQEKKDEIARALEKSKSRNEIGTGTAMAITIGRGTATAVLVLARVKDVIQIAEGRDHDHLQGTADIEDEITVDEVLSIKSHVIAIY